MPLPSYEMDVTPSEIINCVADYIKLFITLGNKSHLCSTMRGQKCISSEGRMELLLLLGNNGQ